MTDAYARYQLLVTEYDSLRPNYEGSIRLVQAITGDEMGRGLPDLLIDKLKQIEGVDDNEDILGNRKKIRVDWRGKFTSRESVDDWDKECELVSGFVSQRKAICEYYTKKNTILREWKDNSVVELSGSDKAEIEALVTDLHDEDLVEGMSVTRIWNDGEIDSQKGGILYGHRSVFTMKPALNITGLVFPVITSSGKFSHAIVTDDDAKSVRELIVFKMTK